MDTTAETTDSSVTWVVDHHVRPERVAEFEEWLRGISEELKRFPGSRDVTVLRPARSAASPQYVVVVRFASHDHLRRWEGSAERADWVGRLGPLVISLPTIRSASGLETWFDVGGGTAMVPPPRWKMAVLASAAIFPLVVLVSLALGWIASGRAYLGVPVTLGSDYLARALITSITLVVLMTWVAMPVLSRLAKRWLYPER